MTSTAVDPGAQDRRVLAAATAALKSLHARLFRYSTDDLAPLLADLAELRAFAGAGLAAVTAEA